MFYPKIDDTMILAVDAASVEDDEMMLSGPSPNPPPAPGVDPWDGPYGHPVTEWTTANGYPALGRVGVLPDPPVPAPGYGLTAPRSWKVDVQLPDGWYTRISRRDKYSK